MNRSITLVYVYVSVNVKLYCFFICLFDIYICVFVYLILRPCTYVSIDLIYILWCCWNGWCSSMNHHGWIEHAWTFFISWWCARPTLECDILKTNNNNKTFFKEAAHILKANVREQTDERYTLALVLNDILSRWSWTIYSRVGPERYTLGLVVNDILSGWSWTIYFLVGRERYTIGLVLNDILSGLSWTMCRWNKEVLSVHVS